MADRKVDTRFNNNSGTDFVERVRLNQQRLIFDARFWRCYRMLHLIACRVLGGSERAEEAIGNCWRIAARLPQRFEHDGEFRGWLLRVLIDEALVLLRENVPRPTLKVLCEPVPAKSSGGTTYASATATYEPATRMGSLRIFLWLCNGVQTRLLEERTNPK